MAQASILPIFGSLRFSARPARPGFVTVPRLSGFWFISDVILAVWFLHHRCCSARPVVWPSIYLCPLNLFSVVSVRSASGVSRHVFSALFVFSGCRWCLCHRRYSGRLFSGRRLSSRPFRLVCLVRPHIHPYQFVFSLCHCGFLVLVVSWFDCIKSCASASPSPSSLALIWLFYVNQLWFRFRFCMSLHRYLWNHLVCVLGTSCRPSLHTLHLSLQSPGGLVFPVVLHTLHLLQSPGGLLFPVVLAPVPFVLLLSKVSLPVSSPSLFVRLWLSLAPTLSHTHTLSLTAQLHVCHCHSCSLVDSLSGSLVHTFVVYPSTTSSCTTSLCCIS